MLTWDHHSREQFYEYYSKASQSEQTLQRFRSARDCILRMLGQSEPLTRILKVADIGCGAGTQSMIWAELGHQVHGLDVNQPLLELAKERADSAGRVIDFRVGSATDLPWADQSMDVCLMFELLEHVAEWKVCLNECIRILKPGGILFLTTSNKLCPAQQEFNLPLYSWYPPPFKRYFERLAVTTHPAIANFATYPAVNWFSFYSLRAVITPHDFQCLDRFDIMDLSKKSFFAKLVISLVQTVPMIRFFAHVATPGTRVMAIKRGAGSNEEYAKLW